MKQPLPWQRYFIFAFASAVALTLFLPLIAIGYRSLWNFDATGTPAFNAASYSALLEQTELLQALGDSFILAILASSVATTLALFAALGVEQKQNSWRRWFAFFMMLPLAVPELVLGVSSLIWFAAIGFPLGFGSLLVSHVTLTLCYAFVVVQLGLSRLPRNLHEASSDLGASPVQFIRYVLLPQLIPTLSLAWILCFILSFDDFMVSYFTAGAGVETLPLRLYGMAKFGIKGELYALATLLVAGTGLLFAGGYLLMARNKAAPLAASR